MFRVALHILASALRPISAVPAAVPYITVNRFAVDHARLDRRLRPALPVIAAYHLATFQGGCDAAMEPKASLARNDPAQGTHCPRAGYFRSASVSIKAAALDVSNTLSEVCQ